MNILSTFQLIKVSLSIRNFYQILVLGQISPSNVVNRTYFMKATMRL